MKLETWNMKYDRDTKLNSCFWNCFQVSGFRFQGLRKGFTLLETVVALTVIMAAVVGPVSLITRGLFDFSFAKNKVIANNLAEEGIELVHLIRENNIACDIERQKDAQSAWPWNSDPRGPQGALMTQLHVGVDAGGFDTVLCGSASIAFPHMSTSCSGALLYEPGIGLSNSGLYGYSGSQDTIFSRCVDITSGPQVQDPTPGIPAADQMDVISTVSWSEHGTPRTVVLQERLYNWR